VGTVGCLVWGSLVLAVLQGQSLQRKVCVGIGVTLTFVVVHA
jgi:hypothetical protein